MKAFAAAVLFMLAGVVLLVDGPTSAAAGLACLGIGFAFLVLVTVQQAWRRPRLHIVVLLFLLGMLMSTTGMPVLSGGGRGPLLDFLVYGGLFVMGLAAILGIRRSIGYLRRPATGTPSAPAAGSIT